ncbi:Isochorismatase-like protein [Myxozyma melibiosi]|uniref:Isochorismatase-like protein n=1 Tax=Myxozyma melibiosi TaxID=54550 RepID=A0ABR1FC40_9ASCO
MAFRSAQTAAIDLSNAALVVIDMQEQFRHTAADLCPVLIPLIEDFIARDKPVFFTQHGHVIASDTSELVRWWGKQGSIEQYSPAWQMMRELEPLSSIHASNIHRLLNKDRYDAFMHTDLELLLREAMVDAVVITGTMTNLCCETTARSAFNRDFYVYFPEDGNATLNAEMQEASLTNLRYGFAQITTVKAMRDAL